VDAATHPTQARGRRSGASRLGLVLIWAACSGSPAGEHHEATVVCPAGAEVEGVDVSYYDGSIDWSAVYGAGKRFAIIRVSDGTSFIDPQFAANWNGTRAAGVMRAPYQFFRAGQDPVAQADLLVAQVMQAGGFQPGDLPPVMDLETADNQPIATVVARAHAWLDRLTQATGRAPIVYTSTRVWTLFGNPAGFSQYPLWVANWGVTCPSIPMGWTDWRFWQSSATGNVAGISNSSMTDLDRFNGTLTDLLTFAGGAAPPDGGGGAGSSDAGASAPDAKPGSDAGGGLGASAGSIAGGCAVAGRAPGGACLCLLICLWAARPSPRSGQKRRCQPGRAVVYRRACRGSRAVPLLRLKSIG